MCQLCWGETLSAINMCLAFSCILLGSGLIPTWQLACLSTIDGIPPSPPPPPLPPPPPWDHPYPPWDSGNDLSYASPPSPGRQQQETGVTGPQYSPKHMPTIAQSSGVILARRWCVYGTWRWARDQPAGRRWCKSQPANEKQRGWKLTNSSTSLLEITPDMLSWFSVSQRSNLYIYPSNVEATFIQSTWT